MKKLIRSILVIVMLCAVQVSIAQEVQPIGLSSSETSISNTELIEQPITLTSIDNELFQDTTSIPIIATKELKATSSATTVWHPNPTRALWLSIVFPGLGQIYNRKYWKLPIVYGGFLGCAYAISWNNKYYQDYLAAYKDIMDADPNTKSYIDMLPYGTDPETQKSYAVSYLNNKQNYYRKYRDLSIIVTVAVYALSVIDAFVDAQLSDFDISPDVSMRVQPTLIANPQQTSLAATSLGMQFRVTF